MLRWLIDWLHTNFNVMIENVNRAELDSLGEFGLIEHLTKDAELKNKSSLKGVGDDAAVLGEGETKHLVSTDLLVEGGHFNLAHVPFEALGLQGCYGQSFRHRSHECKA